MNNYLFKSALTKIGAVAIASAILFGTAQCAYAAEAGISDTAKAESQQTNTSSANGSSYFNQYSELTKYVDTGIKLDLPASTARSASAAAATVNGRTAINLNDTTNWCEWNVNVPAEASLQLTVNYMPDVKYDNDLSLSVTIDGQTPFSEARTIVLPRKWSSVINKGENPFSEDSQGNDIRPEQVQVADWLTNTVEDPQGLYSEPYYFHFKAGQHTVRLTCSETAMFISGISFENTKSISYKEYFGKYDGKQVSGSKITYIQGELSDSTTSPSIYPSYDKLDAATVPSDPKNIRLNTIGGSTWGNQGDSVSWKANVPKEGLYRLAFRARQNINSGLISYRRLTVNGVLPFKEAAQVPFKYSQGWSMFTLGDGENEYMLYLKPGDVITMTSTTGDTSEILRNIQSSVTDLNNLYREILAITSANPDIYQDYNLEKKIPNLEDSLNATQKILMDTYNKLCEILGTKGSLASSIMLSANSVKDFAERPYEIPEKLSSFKSTLESLGSLILSFSQQPLEMDYIAVMPQKAETPKAGGSFWQGITFATKQFIYSFTNDYSSVGGAPVNVDKTINVWITTGRDQAQIMAQLINSDFTDKTRIGVNLNMVDTGPTLIRASLAGKGPDVALMLPQETPVQLAARGALIDLTDKIDEDLKNDFQDASWTRFYYQDKIYGIPESQDFSLIYYRTDVFKQLGITVPNTWDDMYKVMQVIQSNNLIFGISEINSLNMGVSASIGTFASLLEQKGGMFYVDDLSKTQFDTEIAYEAFTQWSKLYTDYGLSRQFDFYSRFRTGEIPMAFGDLKAYAQLLAAAPEIRGLWSIALIPGTKDKDGKINRSEVSTLTGCSMLKAARDHNVEDESYEFMKWWVGAEAQEKYATDLEIAMGVAGRYFSANTEAFSKIGWTSQEAKVIKEQSSWLLNQPTIVGSYEVTRDLTSALREVIAGENRPRRALMLYNSDINEEITRKRKEFNIK